MFGGRKLNLLLHAFKRRPGMRLDRNEHFWMGMRTARVAHRRQLLFLKVHQFLTVKETNTIHPT